VDKLWAPWRSKYLYNRKSKKCIFCNLPTKNKDKSHYIVARRKKCFAILNLYPYNNGHVMVAPYKHKNALSKLTKDEMLEIFELIIEMKKRLKKKLKPDGFNVGFNIGRTAGAGFPGHIHFHIVPRWNGDINFMPVISGTKIISESLESVYKVLKDGK